MTQEYVTVHTPRDRRAERRAARTRLRRVIGVALGIGALGYAALGVLVLWPEPTPDPIPVPSGRTPNAARATAQVYHEWTRRVEQVECLNGDGSTYEPIIVDNRDGLALAAQHLGIEPATAHPQAPVPALRQPATYLGSGGDGDGRLVDGGGCEMPPAQLDFSQTSVVHKAVAAARTDMVFAQAVAEQVWVQEHPAQVTQQFSYLRRDQDWEQSEVNHSDAFSEQLGVVTAAVQEGTVWVPIVTDGREEYAQSVGLVGSGGAVAVRVSGDALMLDEATFMTATDVIWCGPLTITAAVKEPWGTEEDLAEVYGAMGTACNALIGAGFVEAETLADVYWK